MVPLTYTDALATFRTCSWLDPVQAIRLARWTICRAPDGLGYWHLNGQERSALLALITRVNAAYVTSCTVEEFSAAGVPRHALAPVLASLGSRGHLRMLNGPKGLRLFVVIPLEPYPQPEGWASAALHRSMRRRDRPPTASALSAPGKPPRVKPNPSGERVALRARLLALASADGVSVALRQASDARSGRDVPLGLVRAVIDAAEVIERECSPLAVTHALAVTNARRLADGRPIAAEPKRWAAYLKAVARSADEEHLGARAVPAGATGAVAPISDAERVGRRAERQIRALLASARDLNKAGQGNRAEALLDDALALAEHVGAMAGLNGEADARERIALAWRIGAIDFVAAPGLVPIHNFQRNRTAAEQAA